ncbi:UDP-N-acetylmuramoyl-tripeptide--D-alanyl-D-alanine ligase, partial [Candidatus Parcubacteria bacterium]|nr:UDP-N-acetylmuramoyl-tripeptide--D-alanyl-D-alanine ligase [Candidatus Parcubacteria bacterium]
MTLPSHLMEVLEKVGFKVSTDTREDITGSIYFALHGENFDGNKFAHKALEQGAIAAICDDPDVTGARIFQVPNVLKALQEVANIYRKSFNIPIIAIGGSNGKTTSKELLKNVLETKYKLHATTANLNNHIGVPLSILSMDKGVEIGLFEIGANHLGEHTELLQILEPTIVVVTNNGLDHLEGFHSPEGVRRANKEIYDWAREHGRSVAFVNTRYQDLVEDSEGLDRRLYPQDELEVLNSMPLVLRDNGQEYSTHLFGEYNLENIYLALAIGKHFDIDSDAALRKVAEYEPELKRSQIVTRANMIFVVDCYNANPSSMRLALESFVRSAESPRGVILGDMLEMGSYAAEEHLKIVEYVKDQNIDQVIFIGENFKKALEQSRVKHKCPFP